MLFLTAFWQILIWSSGKAEGYIMRHCTILLDLTSRSGFATAAFGLSLLPSV